MNFLVFLYILIVLFSNVLGRIIPINLLDEITFFVCLLVGLLIRINFKLDCKEMLKIWSLLLGLCFLGLTSTFIYKYQTNTVALVKDIVMLLKAPITFFYGLEIFKYLNRNKILSMLNKVIKPLSVIIFIFGVLNLFISIGMDDGFRHGIRTYQFLFTHPTFMVYTLIMFISILFVEKKFSIYILLNIFSLIFSLRDKAYIFIVFYVFLLIFMSIKQKSTKKAYLLIGGIAAFIVINLISFDKLMNSYLIYGERTARGALYINGLAYAVSHFPFGTGLATWGSSISGEYYSPLYYECSMQYIPGIMPDDIAYITDTFWPFIYTQFGFIGLLIYLYLFFKIYKKAIRSSLKNKNHFYSLVLIIFYSVMASFFEGFYTNDSGVYTMLIMLLVMMDYQDKEIKVESFNLLEQK